MQQKATGATRPRHPIKVVSSRTGLSPEVLRVWEKRYGVVHPVRTEGGQRLYSDEEIERLRLLRALTLEGRRIGEVSPLSTENLRALLIEDQDAPRPPAEETQVPPLPENAAFRERALRAVEDLDQPALRSILAQAQLSLSGSEFVEEVVGPLARDLGVRWTRGDLQIHQEHFATVEIRRLLDILMDAASTDPADPRLVVSTPAGEQHELGAMLAAAIAAGEGWRITYLGPDLPAEDLATAARSLDATAVGVSVVNARNLSGVESELRQLRSRLPRRVSLLVGGAALGPAPAFLREIGAEYIEDLRSFRTVLSRIAPEPRPRSR